jgi:hypothetical protein
MGYDPDAALDLLGEEGEFRERRDYPETEKGNGAEPDHHARVADV